MSQQTNKMNAQEGGTTERLKEISNMKEEKVGCSFTNASKKEEREYSGAQGIVTTMADAVRTNDDILNNPDNTMRSDSLSFEGTQLLSKPSLTYIALIAKVILSSPSQKLNLASIYSAMEEQFPHLRIRGPGWRNSVRHNLSVNDCFVKVSRCEDGRGHYWGVHQAHLSDFQQGNFRRYRKARGKGKGERYNEVAGHLTRMETSCLLGRFHASRSMACTEPHCPLQEPGNQMCSSDWTEPHHQPWRVSVAWEQSPSWTKQQHYFPERLPYLYDRTTAGRACKSQPMTSSLHCWDMNGPVLTGLKESCDSRFMTLPIQAVRIPVCWCLSPVKKSLPYEVCL